MKGYYASSNDFASIEIPNKYNTVINIIKTSETALLYSSSKFIAF